MDNDEGVYQLPESTNQDVQKMMVVLGWFIGIALIFAVLFIIYAPSILKWVPFSVEKNFVRPYEEIAERWWGSETFPEIDAYLQSLAEDLSVVMDLPEDFEIEVHYIDSEQVNAFAMLGGHIFVTRGLLEFVEDENSLAMVVAHEIAHQKHRDPITGMSRGIAVQMIYSLVTSDYFSIDLSTMGGELGLLYFSRDQESHADEAAILALQAHYGHVAGYDQFFKGVVEDEESADIHIPEWLSSHPDTSERIIKLKGLEEENDWAQGQTQPIPEDIRALMYKSPI